MNKSLPKDSLGYRISQLLIEPEAAIKIAILVNNDKSLHSLGCRNLISAEDVEEAIEAGGTPVSIIESIISKIEIVDK